MSTFAATVGAWAEKVPDAVELVFKEAAQEIVAELNALVPVDTGFLRASLQASTTQMPVLNRPKQGGGGVYVPDGTVELVIAGAELGQTIYLGYTANYGAYVHYGANGHPGRPWVDMVAQRWAGIVAEKAADVKTRLGL